MIVIMEMPAHLRTLPQEAFDILRYFSTTNTDVARVDDIMDSTGMSERRLRAGVRGLVTKRFLLLDGYQTYRLNEAGRKALNDFLQYEASVPAGAQSSRNRQIMRRLVLVTPRILLSGQPTNIFVGFDDADDDEIVNEPLNLLLRVQVVNSSPDTSANKDTSLLLENRSARQVFEIIPGAYTKVRLRCYIYQIENEEDAPEMAGGMYVDLNVVASPDQVDRTLTAFGVDVQFTTRD
jgi:hypothetical protein